jgi:hypothetical protein
MARRSRLGLIRREGGLVTNVVSSMTYLHQTKSASIFLISFFWLVGLGLPATAQELTYSADSLMATFDNGSKPSLKGTEITFRDVPDVIEIKNSKVIFRSSGNGKVICELGPSTEKRHVQLGIGGPLTVIGKVRGRGLLGNVTLDECHLALIEGTTASPDVISQEPAASASLGDPPQESTAATRFVEPPQELPTAAPIGESQPPTKELVKSKNAQATTPVRGRVRKNRLPPEGPAQPNEVTKEVSDSTKPYVLYSFYAVAVIFVSLVLFAIAKLLSPVLGTVLRRPSNYPNTPEMRQAALEALLSGTKKKK